MLTGRILGLACLSLAASFPVEVMPPADVGRHSSRPWKINIGPATRAQFDFKPYVLSNACLDCARSKSDELFSCNMKFEWYDPNSVPENNVSSCSCSYSWNWDGVTSAPGPKNTFDPEAFFVCYQGEDDDTLFQMRVNGFDSPSNFTLMMAHHYKDSSLWGPPYVYAQTWAEPQLSLEELARQEHSMTYFEAGPILANITGLDD